jgi:hypothetical protein
VKGAVASFLFLAITYGAGRAAESVTPRLGVLEMLGVAVLVAVALDVQSEWRFRRRHGVVASIWPVHQVYAAPAVIEALAAKEIPALPRGLRHRALLQLFGPFVPIEILVPAEKAAAAGELLRAALTPRPGGAPPAR